MESRIFNPLDLTLSRSVYEAHPHSMGTCLAGRLIPAFTFNVLPGDEFTVNKLASLFKMSTPVYPTMDYLYADIAFYFVPYKLIMSRRYASPSVNDKDESWSGFIGAQDFNINLPIPADGVSLPLAPIYDTSNGAGSLGEYLYGPDAKAVTTGSDDNVNALPLMAYFSIWNDNYREPNLQPAITWNYGTLSSGRKVIVPTSGPDICWSDVEAQTFNQAITGGTYQPALTAGQGTAIDIFTSTPLPVSVFHGYFGSMLPWPQRNLDGVSLPVGDLAPVITGDMVDDDMLKGKPALKWAQTSDGLAAPAGGMLFYRIQSGEGKTTLTDNQNGNFVNSSIAPGNLYANLASATAVDVEMLRALITKQHWYEDIARSGNRLDELEYGTFGVRPKDSGCDRPMYLGGKRLQLNVEMVASTNGGVTSGASKGAGSLGDLGAFSHTNDADFYFHQAFDTWGCIQMVFTIRPHNLFASGVDRHWLKKTRDDWYWPEFANLGNEYLSKAEISANGTVDQVLGYQEYAEEWREFRDNVTGLLVPGRSLGFMTYAHRYTSAPTLAQVLDASKCYLDVDRTLAVTSDAGGFQFIYQFTSEMLVRRSVGKYSVPGVSRV